MSHTAFSPCHALDSFFVGIPFPIVPSTYTHYQVYCNKFSIISITVSVIVIIIFFGLLIDFIIKSADLWESSCDSNVTYHSFIWCYWCSKKCKKKNDFFKIFKWDYVRIYLNCEQNQKSMCTHIVRILYNLRKSSRLYTPLDSVDKSKKKMSWNKYDTNVKQHNSSWWHTTKYVQKNHQIFKNYCNKWKVKGIFKHFFSSTAKTIRGD